MTQLKYLTLTIITLLILEFIFRELNKKNGINLPYLLDLKISQNEDNDPNHFEINPLLGWSNKNFKSFQNNGEEIILSYSNEVDKPLQIYISGGSTSDLVLDSTNWPIFLLEEFRKEKKSVEINIASTGGYSSGQELLKLVSRKQKKIDLHISYSGANEVDSPSFVTYYEYDVYNKLINSTPKILPNTISFFKKPIEFTISKPKNNKPEDFWIENMSKMNSLAVGSGYKFVGILQPVAGISSKTPQVMPEGSERYLPLYKKMYPKAIQQLKNKEYIVDFSKIFIDYEQSPFKDDCHLKHIADQKKIALKVAKICFNIMENGL